MKTIRTTIAAILLLAVNTTSAPAEVPGPKPASHEFVRLKSLVGTRKGTTDMGQGPVEMVSHFQQAEALASLPAEREFLARRRRECGG